MRCAAAGRARGARHAERQGNLYRSPGVFPLKAEVLFGRACEKLEVLDAGAGPIHCRESGGEKIKNAGKLIAATAHMAVMSLRATAGPGQRTITGVLSYELPPFSSGLSAIGLAGCVTLTGSDPAMLSSSPCSSFASFRLLGRFRLFLEGTWGSAPRFFVAGWTNLGSSSIASSFSSTMSRRLASSTFRSFRRMATLFVVRFFREA
jgi:hypothetical protein